MKLNLDLDPGPEITIFRLRTFKNDLAGNEEFRTFPSSFGEVPILRFESDVGSQ